jgi:hypothetical protein
VSDLSRCGAGAVTGPLEALAERSPKFILAEGSGGVSWTATPPVPRRSGEAFPHTGQNFDRSPSCFPQYGQNLTAVTRNRIMTMLS